MPVVSKSSHLRIQKERRAFVVYAVNQNSPIVFLACERVILLPVDLRYTTSV